MGHQAIIWTDISLLSIEPIRFSDNFSHNMKLLIHKIPSENCVCEMATVLSRGKWVKLANQIKFAKWMTTPDQIKTLYVLVNYMDYLLYINVSVPKTHSL